MTFVYFHKYNRLEPAPCPICELPGGFHDSTVHSAKRDIPRELLKETGWQKECTSMS